MATDVTVIYHYEGSWWADSPNVERWSAAADELDDLVALVNEGVPFALNVDAADVRLTHLPAPDLIGIFRGETAGGRLRVHVQEAFAGLLNSSDALNPTLAVA